MLPFTTIFSSKWSVSFPEDKKGLKKRLRYLFEWISSLEALLNETLSAMKLQLNLVIISLEGC